MKSLKGKLGMVIAIGSVWGFAEAGLGMYLRGVCARFITGSVMTGIAIFFLSLAYGLTRKTWTAFVLLGLVSMLKLLDACLLHLPILHGAIANPMYAFITEALAFVFVVSIISKQLSEKFHGRAIMGAFTALVAVNLFPLVKLFTGIPACVKPGTTYPLALYYLPVSIGISLFTCPLGILLGEKLALAATESKRATLIRIIPQIATLLSIALIILLRTL